eukprot:m.59125 g.59125  ORF g.59125 m.59125 type:complete len:350 (-) comp11750_c0_seq3:1757-2806(-)
MEATNLPWVEKYRPASLDHLISHQDIIATIRKFMDEDRLPHLLFYGPPGTGKTSTIKACAAELYGKAYGTKVLELNASDDRGISVVREQIKTFASTRAVFNDGFKLVILDEADAMTNDAQAALRRVIEKFTKNTRFCIICNYVSKISPALQSRCTKFRFAPLSTDQMKIQIDRVVEAEKLNVTADGLDALIRLATGDMRKALNVLQSTSMASDIVSATNVYICTGTPLPEDIEAIMSKMVTESFTDAFRFVSGLKVDKGLALVDIVRDLHSLVFTIDFDVESRLFILDRLAQLEYVLPLALLSSNWGPLHSIVNDCSFLGMIFACTLIIQPSHAFTVHSLLLYGLCGVK